VTTRHATDDEDRLLDCVRHLLASTARALTVAVRILRAIDAGQPAPMWCSTVRAAGLLSMTTKEVVEAIHADELPAQKIAGRWVIAVADLIDFEAGRQRP